MTAWRGLEKARWTVRLEVEGLSRCGQVVRVRLGGEEDGCGLRSFFVLEG